MSFSSNSGDVELEGQPPVVYRDSALDNIKKREGLKWSDITRNRVRARVTAQELKKPRKAMKPEVKSKLELRNAIMNGRPISANKSMTTVMAQFGTFIQNLSDQQKRTINYDQKGMTLENYDVRPINNNSSLQPFYVNQNGYLAGGRRIAMTRTGTHGSIPLIAPDGRQLLSAVAKYWNPRIFPHVRLVKFVAHSIYRKDNKPRIGGLNVIPKEVSLGGSAEYWR